MNSGQLQRRWASSRQSAANSRCEIARRSVSLWHPWNDRGMPIASQLRKSGFRTYGVLSLAITISLAIFAAFSWRYYETLVSDARMETSRYSLLLAEQATRTFEAV